MIDLLEKYRKAVVEKTEIIDKAINILKKAKTRLEELARELGLVQ